jgi:HSP20 family protein
MKESEIKVTTTPEKEASFARWPGFDTGFFRGNWFENPFSMMKRFSDEMDRFFNLPRAENAIWTLAVEVKEEAGKLLISAELPGVKPEDVKVTVTEDALVLEGERKYEREERRQGFYHSERRYGRFYRAIPLPKGAHTDKASAAYRNGVLEVAIPIPESKPKTREIPVMTAA